MRADVDGCGGGGVRVIYLTGDIHGNYDIRKLATRGLTDYLEHVRETVSFERWFFGHYHVDRDYDDGFSALYERVVPLTL